LSLRGVSGSGKPQLGWMAIRRSCRISRLGRALGPSGKGSESGDADARTYPGCTLSKARTPWARCRAGRWAAQPGVCSRTAWKSTAGDPVTLKARSARDRRTRPPTRTARATAPARSAGETSRWEAAVIVRRRREKGVRRAL